MDTELLKGTLSLLILSLHRLNFANMRVRRNAAKHEQLARILSWLVLLACVAVTVWTIVVHPLSGHRIFIVGALIVVSLAALIGAWDRHAFLGSPSPNERPSD